jgi:integrase
MPYKISRKKRTAVPGIVQIGPSRFLVRARWNDPRTGQRRTRKGTATTFAQAVALQEQLKGTESKPKPIKQRFKDYAEQWMRVHASEYAVSTRERYISAIAHASAFLGPMWVEGILPSDIREWRSRKLNETFSFKKKTKKRKYARTTINSWHRVLCCVFDDAVTDGVIQVNPAKAIPLLEESRLTSGRRGRSLSREQFKTFVTSIENRCDGKITLAEDIARLLLTAAWTGMRRGELLALRWDDLIDGEIHVTRSVWRRNAKTTKTDDPRRIAIVEPLKNVFDDQRKWLLKTQHPGLSSGLIFPASPTHAGGGAKRRKTDELSWYRSPTIFVKPLKKIVDHAGIPDISGHSLRRTYEDMLRKAGVESLVRRSIAGWRTEKAQAIYATVSREERDSAALAVVNFIMS